MHQYQKFVHYYTLNLLQNIYLKYSLLQLRETYSLVIITASHKKADNDICEGISKML